MTGTWEFTPSADVTPVTINAPTTDDMQLWVPVTNEVTVVTDAGDLGVGEAVPTANVSIRARGSDPDAAVLALGPYAWWDASNVDGANNAVGNGANITSWYDKSLNGHTLPAEVATTNTLHTTTGPNNKPYVTVGSFTDAGNSWVGAPMTSHSGWCVFLVYKNADLSDGPCHFLRGNLDGHVTPDIQPSTVVAFPFTDEGALHNAGAYINYGAGGGTDTGFYKVIDTPTPWLDGSSNHWYAFVWSCLVSGVTTHRAFHQDGEMSGTTGDATGGSASQSLAHFRWLFKSNPGLSNQSQSVAEMILFDKPLSDSDRATVQAYLANKYSGTSTSTANQPLTDWKSSTGTINSIVDQNIKFGLGTSTPAVKLHVVDTTGQQVRIAYDSDSYTGFTVGSGSAAISYTLPNASAVGLLHNSAGSVWSWSSVDLTADVTGVLPIARGGTNSGTALSGSSIIISNGSAIVQGAAGTTTTVLHGNAAGAPTYSAVSLTADVSGDLPFANLAQGSARSILGVAGNATADVASVQSSAAGQVPFSTSTSWSWASLATAGIVSGSGTTNHLARWTPSGTVLGDSLATDDGTNVVVQTPTVTGVTGALLQVRGGNDVFMQAGDFIGGGGGASLDINPGASTNGGEVVLATGDGFGAGDGGRLTFQSGAAGSTGSGGILQFLTSDGGATSGSGGQMTYICGSGVGGNSAGGFFEMTAGNGFGAGAGGAWTATAGTGGATGVGAAVQLLGGLGGATSGNGGAVAVRAGDAQGAGNGGDASFVCGDGGVTSGSGGAFLLRAGDTQAAGSGGNLNISSGSVFNGDGNGGQFVMTAGSADSASTGDGGTLTISSGNAGDIGAGGSYTMSAGAGGATSGDGGGFTMSSGSASGDGSGGTLYVNAGSGAGSAGAGGAMIFTTGSGAASGNAGDFSINCGSSGAAGGNVIITLGLGTPNGDFIIRQASGFSNVDAAFDARAITANRRYTFPDADLDFNAAFSGIKVINVVGTGNQTFTWQNGILVSVV